MARDISISWILLAILAACTLSGCCSESQQHKDWTDYYFAHEWRTMNGEK